MPRSYRLELIKQLIDREFKKEIQELRGKKAHRDEIQSKEYDHHFELRLLAEEQESMYCDRLLKKARRLRVSSAEISQME